MWSIFHKRYTETRKGLFFCLYVTPL
jgi:hypothetical protein